MDRVKGPVPGQKLLCLFPPELMWLLDGLVVELLVFVKAAEMGLSWVFAAEERIKSAVL